MSSVNGYPFQGASRLSNSDIVFDDVMFWGAVLFSTCSWLNISFLGPDDLRAFKSLVSLFKSKQKSTNHVSTSNHSRAKNQVNKILCNIFSPFTGSK